MNITMKSLQSPLLVLSQQRCDVKNLVRKLCSGIGVCFVAEDRSYESLEMTECLLQGRFGLKFSSISEVIADQGSWARNILASLPLIGVKVGRVANLGTFLILGFFLASLSLC
jgi:hypothetical protein